MNVGQSDTVNPPSPLADSDERALSPLVSTLLIVSLAILLSATIGVAVFIFVSDVGAPGPTATFETEYAVESGQLTVTLYHANGDPLERDQLTVTGRQSGRLPLTSQDAFAAGDRIVDGAQIQSDEELLVQYETSETDDSYVIDRESAPDVDDVSSIATATPTPTLTPTTTPTTTSGGGGGSGGSGGGSIGGGIPGFRLPTVAVAILFVTLLARRRGREDR